MAEYTVSDPKSGAQYKFSAPDSVSQEDVMRKASEFFNKPPPSGEGAGLAAPPASEGGSTGLNLARAGLRAAPGVIGAALLPEAIPGAEVLGGGMAAAKAAIGRAGLAAAGQGIGDAAARLASGEPMGGLPSAGAAGATQLIVDAAGRMLFAPGPTQRIADALGNVTKFSSHPAGANATLAGQYTRGVLPGANKAINNESRRLYDIVKAEGSKLPPVSITNAPIYHSAIAARDSLGQPAQTIIPDSVQARTRTVINSIIDRGAPKVDAAGIPIPVKPVTFTEVQKWKREMNEILPSYNDRLNPDTYTAGILNNMNHMIDQQLDTMAQGTKAESALKAARDFHRDEVVPWRATADEIARNEATPTNLVTNLTKSGQYDHLVRLYKNVDQDTRDIFSNAWFADTMDKSRDANGIFDGATMLKEWKKLGRGQKVIGQGKVDQLNTIFEQLDTIVRKDKLVSSPGFRGGVTGSVSATALLGSASKFATGNVVGGMRDLVVAGLAPIVMPTLLTNPAVRSALAKGLPLPAGTNIAIRHGKIIAQAIRAIPGALASMGAPTDQQQTIGPSVAPYDHVVLPGQ